MIYVFRSESGDIREEVYPIGEAPKIGDSVVLDGVAFTRIPVIPEARVSPNIHFVSHSLPRAQRQPDGSWYSPYSKNVEPDTGKPRFESMHGIHEATGFSKWNDGDRAVTYD